MFQKGFLTASSARKSIRKLHTCQTAYITLQKLKITFNHKLFVLFHIVNKHYYIFVQYVFLLCIKTGIMRLKNGL